MSPAHVPDVVNDLPLSRIDLEALAQITDETLRRHGLTAAGAGWADAASQELRFQLLAQAVHLPPSTPLSVNDLGCGYGALYDYLTGHGVVVTQYHGYDICDAMLRAARHHVDVPQADFRESPRVTEVADFSFLSGPLNLKTAEDDAWKHYARSVVRNLARRSRVGFAFNMMTTKVTYRSDALFYADPEEWLAWCRSEIAADFMLIEDYPLYEWTIGGVYGSRSRVT